MTTIYLVRHGRSTANQKGLLAGRTPKVALDEVGKAQARALGEFFSSVAVDNLISSPLERCVDTAKEIKKFQDKSLKVQISKDFIECDYGTWTNKKLSKLTSQSLWKVIQETPSLVTFPQGEAMLEMATRATAGLISALEKNQNPKATLLIVTHADLIKALISNALGMHLDHFQKLIVDPASISTLTFQKNKFYVAGVNDRSHLGLKQNKSDASARAVLGGGAG